MKSIKKLLFTITLLVSAPVFAMEAPSRPQEHIPALPADVLRYMIPFVAECNAYKVAEVIRCLNATNKFFHESIQSEEIMLKILDRMPYTSNAITLFYKLQSFPVMKKDTLNFDWRYAHAGRVLMGGGALIMAAWGDDQVKMSELLSLKNIDLNCDSSFGSPLIIAISKNNKEIFEMLLQAGTDVNSQNTNGGKTPLIEAVEYANIEIIQRLLEAGADPLQRSIGGMAVDYAHDYCSNWARQENRDAEKVRRYKVIMELLDQAIQQKKEKLKQYQKQSAQSCVIA